MSVDEIRIFSGNANRGLAEEICRYVDIPQGNADVDSFSDGETCVQINDNVRGADVFLVQSTCPPTNQNLMELLIMIDAVKRASARRITAVIPYYGYARQDRKVQPRVPISAKLVADLLTVAGTHRMLTIDLHVGQIQGFFNIPVDHLFAAPVIIDYFKNKNINDMVIVSPDAGGVERARAVAKRLNTSIAIIDKRREEKNVAKAMHVIGNVHDKNLILLDDMIDTAGSITQSVGALKQYGAKDIYACCTHGVFSGNAMERINNSELKEVVTTNTIPLGDKKSDKIVVLSVAKFLADAIVRIHQESSVSSLFV
ncbi:MAG: ribose-phosphate pyrophosphokinase [bacterium]|nr:ribose-phosphate pyrophosphokinase [bacterium]